MNRKVEIICASCGHTSFPKHSCCRMCKHQRGWILWPNAAPPTGKALAWHLAVEVIKKGQEEHPKPVEHSQPAQNLAGQTTHTGIDGQRPSGCRHPRNSQRAIAATTEGRSDQTRTGGDQPKVSRHRCQPCAGYEAQPCWRKSQDKKQDNLASAQASPGGQLALPPCA